MTNLTVIILTGNEELHIGRCLEKLRDLNPRQVLVVESQKGDQTHEKAVEVARRLQWQVKVEGQDAVKVEGVGLDEKEDIPLCTYTSNLNLIWHDWPGLQSSQFNWTLDNCQIEGQWILRLDADEYLADECVAWLKENLDKVPSEVSALELTLERKFCGGLIRHATNGIKMVRMFRLGKARYEETLMDERLIIDGAVLSVPVTFYDDNLNSMDWWREKHRGYAKREAAQALAGTFQDPRKAKYYRLPPYLRAVAYFCIRYFLKGGFLDGYGGWMWNFWQGLWYRWIVDREIARLRRESRA